MKETVGIVLGTLGLIMIIIAVVTYPTMWLWNYYMPTMFNLPKMSFWGMFGFIVLIKLLFGQTISVNKDKK